MNKYELEKLPCFTVFDAARRLIEHENLLVHHRMTWFYAMNTILWAAFYYLLQNHTGNLSFFFTIEQDRTIEAQLLGWTVFGTAKPTDIIKGVLLLVLCIIGQIFCRVISDGIYRANEATIRVNQYYGKFLERHGKCHLLPPLHHYGTPKPLNPMFLPRLIRRFWLGASICIFAASSILNPCFYSFGMLFIATLAGILLYRYKEKLFHKYNREILDERFAKVEDYKSISKVCSHFESGEHDCILCQGENSIPKTG